MRPALLGLLAASALACSRPPTRQEAPQAYAGSASCAPCHPRQHTAWTRSHHARAQRPAEGEQAFDRAPGSRAGERVFVTAPGPHGRTQRFPVTAVIGVAPLYQGLVAFEGGRLQVTALAWDVARREWFDLHAPEARRPEEWGYWTNRGMTWNTQCAECHVTGYRKGYDPEQDVFRSRWAEAGVGCEACHGPRSRHVLDPHRTPRGAKPELGTCAVCHARRARLVESDGAFLDVFDPALPDDPAYYPDGQTRDEDFEWGSFAQSRMHAKGVTCLDCHEPHAGELRRTGNALCLACHRSDLDGPKHTLHARGGLGGACVDCHMPLTTYMLRHPRRDHGFTKPLPELTVRLGVPNACNRCHRGRKPEWALARFEEGYGRRERPELKRTMVVEGARRGVAEAVPGLLGILEDRTGESVAWRAAAASLLAAWSRRPDVEQALLRALTDTADLVRARAARALGGAQPTPPVRSALVVALGDPVRLVRVAAAAALDRPDGLDAAQTKAFQAALVPTCTNQRT